MLNSRTISAFGLLTCLLLAACAGAADSPAIDPATPAAAAKEGWELTFSDEFGGKEIDKARWAVMDKKDRAAENVKVSGGLLRLVTGKDKEEWTGA